MIRLTTIANFNVDCFLTVNFIINYETQGV